MTGAALEKYTHFDASHDSTHNLVVGLVPPGARVLEFGCASGYMSAELRQRLGCHVTGIERDPAAAELAHGHAERVIAGDAETLDYVDLFEGERFDVLLFADVLEHLLDPAGLLRRVRPLLAEGGIVVASIPNVAHGSVRVALLGGEFRYTAKGLLDDTHLRFFTRDSVAELFESAGFVIDEWQRKSAPIDQTEVAVPELAALDLVRAQLDADPEATTYQFVVRARRLEDTDAPRPPRAELELLRAEVEGREAALRRLERHRRSPGARAGRARSSDRRVTRRGTESRSAA
jgi:2-polyprenyl-3-methyl-5-hydroxy-6-metoxy-1,4-benzoquinol methylase